MNNAANRSNTPRSSISSKTPFKGTTKKSYGPAGCKGIKDGRTCGETRNLQIIQEFTRLYETKMQEIDDAAGGDCIQAKINLQQEWIRDLTDQNEMLVRVVEELEVEAAERVNMLEEKLEHSAQCACEVMDGYRDFSINFLADFQKLAYVQNDLNNLVEVLKRVHTLGIWSWNDLNFNTINMNELMNSGVNGLLRQKNTDKDIDCNCNWSGDKPKNCKNEKLATEKEKRVKHLEELLENVEKNKETKVQCQQLTDLRKSMLDMRDALTAEVAEKHDTILCLRRELHMLEDQCRKADQQTHFKDDIIKELRKEIKQLKLQVHEIEEENQFLKDAIIKVKKNLQKLEDKAEKYLEERDDIKQKHRESLEVIDMLQRENSRSKDSIQTLEEEKKLEMARLHNKMVLELEDYENKHRDSIDKLGTLRCELQKTKDENTNSLTQVQTLSEEAQKYTDRELDKERQKRRQEVENLKLTIRELEKTLHNKEMNAGNLQSAVDLYMNSISVLEQSEEHYKNEVAQQRLTIANLQEILVITKQQVDELKEKGQKDLEDKCLLLDILDMSLIDLEKQCYHYYNQYLNSLSTAEFLRDELLKLEVEKFDLTQDVLLLESRLLKYQEISKQYEGKYLGQECSEYCIKQSESVVTLAKDTISFTEELQCQLGVMETALKREQKISMVQANRIEELQNIIGAKNLELNRTNDAYQDMKSKLDAATLRSKTLEAAIQELQEQINEVEMDNVYQGEKVDICHEELDICLNNLQSVKHKLRAQYKAMSEKMQQHAKLEADYRIQMNNAEMLKRDLENTRIRYRDEVIELKHNIRDLKEKLSTSEDKMDALNKDIKHVQAQLVEASLRESKIKQDTFIREKQLTEKIHSAQEEEMRLLDVVTQLEQQLADMKRELDSQAIELESAKQTVLKLNTDCFMKQQMSQEEINQLKNQINSLLQQQGAHKVENERLQKQVECMKCCIKQNEIDSQNTKQQMDRCLYELKSAETDKHFLEQRNVKLLEALDKMQTTLQTKTASIATMEVELTEAKCSRDEICNESRNVVFNVRAWVDEQKKINEELKTKLQKKNALIAKYEQERRRNCECNPLYPRQRAGAQQPNYFQNNQSPFSRSPWSLDSRGSGSESPTSSVSSTPADWYEFEEVGYDAIIEEPTAEIWIHRVESMTEELQRSNRYWKKKINDSEFMVTKDK